MAVLTEEFKKKQKGKERYAKMKEKGKVKSTKDLPKYDFNPVPGQTEFDETIEFHPEKEPNKLCKLNCKNLKTCSYKETAKQIEEAKKLGFTGKSFNKVVNRQCAKNPNKNIKKMDYKCFGEDCQPYQICNDKFCDQSTDCRKQCLATGKCSEECKIGEKLHITDKHQGKMQGLFSLNVNPELCSFCRYRHFCKELVMPHDDKTLRDATYLKDMYSKESGCLMNPDSVDKSHICSYCYAWKDLYAMGKKNRIHFNLNHKILTESIIPKEEVFKINKYGKKSKFTPYFRFNSSGELDIDPEATESQNANKELVRRGTNQMTNYMNLVKANPEVRFALYTKQDKFVIDYFEKHPEDLYLLNNEGNDCSSTIIKEVDKLRFPGGKSQVTYKQDTPDKEMPTDPVDQTAVKTILNDKSLKKGCNLNLIWSNPSIQSVRKAPTVSTDSRIYNKLGNGNLFNAAFNVVDPDIIGSKIKDITPDDYKNKVVDLDWECLHTQGDKKEGCKITPALKTIIPASESIKPEDLRICYCSTSSCFKCSESYYNGGHCYGRNVGSGKVIMELIRDKTEPLTFGIKGRDTVEKVCGPRDPNGQIQLMEPAQKMVKKQKSV